jgi:hypothetical protein
MRIIEKENNMSNVIDGVNLDVPPLESQIIELADHHRKLPRQTGAPAGA